MKKDGTAKVDQIITRHSKKNMAESAVSIVIDKLLLFLTQEVKLLKGVREKVTVIKDDLEAIRAFIKDADSKAEKEGINEGVKVWVKQARDVAYHIEDVIDDYMLRVAQHGDRHGFLGFLHGIPSLVTKLHPDHETASEIQDITETLQKIKDRSEGFRFTSSHQEASSSNARKVIPHDPRLSALSIKEAELVGIESQRDELISLLVSGASMRTVISVVGLGGVGKTTLAKKVYDNHRVKQHFGCHAWITVSQSYDKNELLRSMLKQFYDAKKEPFPETSVTMDISTLISKFTEYLRLERFLVIFDDVWEIGFLGDVEHVLLDNDSGSRILITTRNKDVANFCRRSSLVHVHQVEPLAHKEAWELFTKKAFKFQFKRKCPKDLEELSHDIVRRCGGLPLAIVAVGGLLAAEERTVMKWKRLLDCLSFALLRDPHLENVTKILSLSYGDLPYNLKSCFLYLGMFPEDFCIGRGRLIRLWVAGGFVMEKQGMTLEEVADEYLTELIHRSLVQVDIIGSKGTLRTCRVHDLVREVILSKLEELNLGHISKDNPIFEGIARHLSISNRGSDDGNSTTKSRTRSIMVFNGVLKLKMFAKFKLLNSLDLEGCEIHGIPKELGNLLHLRYLNLRGTKVSKLPKSFGKLRNLEFLDLRGSLVKELPVEINSFPKLRSILGNHDGLKIRGSIGLLQFIQTLFIIRADDGDDDVRFINELGMLKKLGKLGIVNLKREHGKDLCIVLEKMTHLRTLFVASVNDKINDVQSMSCPPPNLGNLSLWGELERLPDWIPKLLNLAKLNLGYSRLLDDPIEVLQTLPKLKFLGLDCGYNGDKMHFDGGGFQKLKRLYLNGLSGLKIMIINEGAMPLLEELRIGAFPQMKEVPPGIQHLKDLRKLYFAGMSNEFNLRVTQDDSWILKHVPFLQHDGTYDPDDERSYGAHVKQMFG